MGWLGLSGRCSRPLYLILVGGLFLIPIIANVIHVDTSVASAFWLTVYARRLHDCGRSVWWGVGVLVLAAIPLFLSGALGGASFRYALLHNGIDDSGHHALAYFAVIGVSFLIQHSLTVWLGMRKGEEGVNRFGPAPKRWGTANHRATGREATIWEARLWEDEGPGPPVTAPAAPSLRTPSGRAQFASRDPRPVFGRRPG